MENTKTFSLSQFQRFALLLRALFVNNDLEPINEGMEPEETITALEGLVWSESQKRNGVELGAINYPILAEVRQQVEKINRLDGNIYGNPKGYEARTLNMPNCLRDSFVKEVLAESNSNFNPEDIDIKRYNGMEISYVGSPKYMNGGSVRGFVYPIQVGMGVRKEIEQSPERSTQDKAIAQYSDEDSE